MSMNYLRSGVPIASLDVPGLGLATKGLDVIHPVFGRGTIADVVRFRDGKHALSVTFQRGGNKLLAPEYARLRLA